MPWNQMFIQIPKDIKIYYLDTCVWSDIVQSKLATDNFVSYFKTHNYIAALSQFTVFELSRAEALLERLDKLFFGLRYNIWMPCLYSQVITNELGSYPVAWTMTWMPLSKITGETYADVMTKLAKNPVIITNRDSHLEFGYTDFMNLENYKKNFPAKQISRYSPEDAEYFSWCNAVNYLSRHYMDFLSQFKNCADNLDTAKLPSLQIRSLLLFYKYYIHGQSPGKSDFLDFAHVSYAPYVDVYLTEHNVSNVLKHIKRNGHILSGTNILHNSEFMKEISVL